MFLPRSCQLGKISCDTEKSLLVMKVFRPGFLTWETNRRVDCLKFLKVFQAVCSQHGNIEKTIEDSLRLWKVFPAAMFHPGHPKNRTHEFPHVTSLAHVISDEDIAQITEIYDFWVHEVVLVNKIREEIDTHNTISRLMVRRRGLYPWFRDILSVEVVSTNFPDHKQHIQIHYRIIRAIWQERDNHLIIIYDQNRRVVLIMITVLSDQSSGIGVAGDATAILHHWSVRTYLQKPWWFQEWKSSTNHKKLSTWTDRSIWFHEGSSAISSTETWWLPK